ncbi:MAG: YceI family protein [Bacillota bacterium]
MRTLRSAILAVLFLASSLFAQPDSWRLDQAHSKVQFTVSHMVISEVTGHFKNFDANVTGNKDDLSDANINFTIDVNSIDTDNQKRDEHLKSDDFFNAAKYPQIKFKGKSLKKISGNKYKLSGDFTIRDITKPLELDVIYGGTVKDMSGNQRSGFKVSGTINRFDYNLKWNKLLETGSAVVGKDVNLLCNVEFVKDAQQNGAKLKDNSQKEMKPQKEAKK